jgi:effector-binding domain-containing protein
MYSSLKKTKKLAQIFFINPILTLYFFIFDIQKNHIK